MRAVDIAYVCYPVTGLSRAREFYERILGLRATSTWVKDDLNGMVEYEIGPGTLAIGAGAESFRVGDGGAAAAIELEDFKDAVKELKGRQCEFLIEPTETPVCHMAMIADPDGNKIMLHQRKKS